MIIVNGQNHIRSVQWTVNQFFFSPFKIFCYFAIFFVSGFDNKIDNKKNGNCECLC